MKVILVNRFFYPDISATSQLLSDLAFHLATRFDVHVVASRQKYDRPQERLLPSERICNVTVHRVWTTQFGRASLPGRALDYLTFYLSASLRLLRLVGRGDIVIPMTDPPLIAVPASLAARAKKARVVNWVQDLFPEVAHALGFRLASGALGQVLRRMRDRSLAAAVSNVALGDLMRARIVARGVNPARVEVIHNWAAGHEVKPLDSGTNSLRRDWGLAGKFVVGYSGNMGRAHDLVALLNAAEKLLAHPEFVFLFVGAGQQRETLVAETARRGLTNVMFQPYQPREALGVSLTVPDCHIVSLKPALEGLIVPSKLYSSMASGRPVLYLGSAEGEIGRLMQTSECFGLRADADDTDAIAQAILQMGESKEQTARWGANGRRLFEREFEQSIALTRWSILLSSLAKAPD